MFSKRREATGTPFRDTDPNSNWSPDELRKHFVAASGEFVGTFLFLFFSFGGTQVANMITPPGAPNPSQLLFIALSFGFSLAVTAWAFYRISGGLFNPAVCASKNKLAHHLLRLTNLRAQVTLGMCISGTLPWIRGLFLFIAQMISGVVAAAVVSALFPGPLVVETVLNNGTSTAQGLFIEMFLTAELLITVLMLAAEKSKATFLAPIGIGLSLFVAELTGMSFQLPPTPPLRCICPKMFDRCVLHRRVS